MFLVFQLKDVPKKELIARVPDEYSTFIRVSKRYSSVVYSTNFSGTDAVLKPPPDEDSGY
jgi:hypothetical protein